MSKTKIIKLFGGLLLTFGILLGVTLSGIMIWGDLEASLFTSGLRADKSLRTLRCPVVITAGETGKITAELNNPTEKKLERYLIANISEGYASLVREVRTSLPIPPEEKQKVEWKIYPEDAAFNERVILFRVYINPRHPHPSLDAKCGVVRVNVEGLNGNQIVTSSAFLAIASMGAGAGLIEFGSFRTKTRSRSTINSAYALAGLVVGAGVLGYLGLWIPGIAILAVGVLLLCIIVTGKLGGSS